MPHNPKVDLGTVVKVPLGTPHRIVKYLGSSSGCAPRYHLPSLHEAAGDGSVGCPLHAWELRGDLTASHPGSGCCGHLEQNLQCERAYRCGPDGSPTCEQDE